MVALEGVSAPRRAVPQGTPVPIQISMPPGLYQKLAARAKAQGYRATQYAQMLFEAGYAARVAQERDEEPADAELDRCVRLVFMLAECETAFIAEQLGLPVQVVERIIVGWKRTAEDLAAGLPTTPTEPSDDAPSAPRRNSRMSDQETGTIVRMWREGSSGAAIAEALGRPTGAIQQWISKHRDRCPKRQGRR